MVSPEYPPINGGVGRYTYNLVNDLKKQGMDVYVVCDKHGKGDFLGISPGNTHNYKLLLELVDKIQPDIVHVQYEPGLYGLKLHPLRPSKIRTSIDLFYDKCRVPIVTTFHSDYTFRQWMKIPEMKKKKKEEASATNDERHILPIRLKDTSYNIAVYWKYLINYEAFQNQNKEKVRKSNTGVVFSDYMKTIIGAQSNKRSSKKVRVIYHGAEPAMSTRGISKKEARSRFPHLPQRNSDKIALAFGFMTVAKG
jgi:glycosyltransferase involved in cell wall biosynthesis